MGPNGALKEGALSASTGKKGSQKGFKRPNNQGTLRGFQGTYYNYGGIGHK
jgi:hypothetical protein